MDRDDFENAMSRILPQIDVDTLERLHGAAKLLSDICPPEIFYEVAYIAIAHAKMSEGDEKALDLANRDWAATHPETLRDAGLMLRYYEGMLDIKSIGEWMYMLLWTQNDSDVGIEPGMEQKM